MIGKFRKISNLSNRKLDKIHTDSLKLATHNYLVRKIVDSKLSDESLSQLTVTIENLRCSILNEHTKPRKLKKVYRKALSDEYNLYLTILIQWENLKKLYPQLEDIESQREIL